MSSNFLLEKIKKITICDDVRRIKVIYRLHDKTEIQMKVDKNKISLSTNSISIPYSYMFIKQCLTSEQFRDFYRNFTGIKLVIKH